MAPTATNSSEQPESSHDHPRQHHDQKAGPGPARGPRQRDSRPRDRHAHRCQQRVEHHRRHGHAPGRVERRPGPPGDPAESPRAAARLRHVACGVHRNRGYRWHATRVAAAHAAEAHRVLHRDLPRRGRRLLRVRQHPPPADCTSRPPRTARAAVSAEIRTSRYTESTRANPAGSSSRAATARKVRNPTSGTRGNAAASPARPGAAGPSRPSGGHRRHRLQELR